MPALASITRLALPLLLPLLPVGWAATCSGDTGANPWVSYAWDIRQAVCGDGACEAAFAGDNSRNACNTSMPFGGGWSASWTATDSAGKYANCWDASENIINQCFVSGDYKQSSGSSTGTWSLGSESYTLALTFSQAAKDWDGPSFYLEGSDGTPPPIDNPAPPIPSTTTTSSSSTSSTTTTSSSTQAPTATLTCSHDCRGWVPNPDWCIANCPCFTAHSVC